ncbi:MAG: glycosyltransferase family 4 protein [Ottowia sp.]|uniref:glycosyltransferase family 4 protein n=1 Tax=Ottowia sp. TaxID=1898956 RepID=UPI003C739CF5
MSADPAIWFPTVCTGTGTDVFTERLVSGLRRYGLRAEITWLPLRAEYAPWTIPVPQPPPWATITHVNTWLHARFLPNNLPLVATIHHAVHHPDARTYKGTVRAIYHSRWIAPNERRILRRAARVIAVSQFVADSARQTLLDVPMDVIYNGINTDTFCPPSTPRKSRRPFHLLYVGSWQARKGVDLLPKILGDLGDGFKLYYTGGPASESDKPCMPPNMHDLGRLKGDAAVVTAMQQADLLILPSRSEGHPLVAIEAMACGLPIIGMRGSSVAEAVTHGTTGLLCSRDDVLAFATAVRNLSDNTKRYTEMAQAARENVTLRFSETIMLKAYIDLYQQLVPLTTSTGTRGSPKIDCKY